MRNALALHLKTLESVAGEPITYRRGSTSYPLTATLARKRQDLQDALRGNAPLTTRVVDWLIKPFSADVLASLVEPKASDTIITEDGRTFEVKANTAGSPCWEWSDPRHTFYRIHTNELRTQ